MNNLPTLYICMTILFFGITAYAALQYAYIYIRMPRKETLPPLVFSSIACLYISSDAIGLFFAFIIPVDGMMKFFVIVRELIPLSLSLIAPYFMNRALALQTGIKKINSILLWTGAASTVLIAALTAYRPDLLITGAATSNPYFGIIYQHEIGPLLIIKNIIVIVYLFYTVALILFSQTHGKHFVPMKNHLIGIVFLCYFALSYLYFLLFTENQTGFGAVLYPHFAAGAVLLIIFMNFGMVDVFIRHKDQLSAVITDLDRQLYYDELLGIPNRMSFMKDLQSELFKIKSTGGDFSLIFLDIDDFKNLNEYFGEGVGNEILKKFSQRLVEYFSWAGALYRIGGDDFVFLVKAAHTPEETKSLAGKIVTSLRNSFSVSGISYLVTASLGIIQVPNDGKDTENILTNAYSVIRSAKKIKNTFVQFTQELIDGPSKMIHIVNILRSSIDRDQFSLLYQPVVDINKNLIYAEALLRCTNIDPDIGGPGLFIPLMEEAGLINDVDNMVVRKVFHDMEMRIKNRFRISINLSTNQLVNPAYSDFLSSFAHQHGIENRQIILEVTETNLMKNMSIGRENLLKLRNSGFSVAIDDFGKGFSSLTYLAELPVDILKMDMVFIQSVPGDGKKEAMAKHIIELAHSLNLKVVAEGFELAEQFEFFKGLGCDLYQGYYFSLPLALNEFLAAYPEMK